MLAADRGYAELVVLLIDRGADVNATDSSKWTPLEYAVKSKQEPSGRVSLLSRKAESRSQSVVRSSELGVEQSAWPFIAFGMIHGKPSGAFSPVAVTPDELGNAWRDCRLHLPLHCSINGKLFGDPDAGAMIYGFDLMVAYAARTRSLGSGTIIGGGTVSNAAPERGYACIIERRAVEEMSQSAIRTSYLRFGDRVRIEMFDSAGRSLFGAIDQKVVMMGEAR